MMQLGHAVVCLTSTTLPLPCTYTSLFIFFDCRWTLWKAKLEVQDAQRQPIMVVNGPCCPCSCGSDVEFPVSWVLFILQPSVIRWVKRERRGGQLTMSVVNVFKGFQVVYVFFFLVLFLQFFVCIFTGGPDKRRVWLFIRNIKECMGEYWRVLLS